jgi:hypothetical protein
MPKCPYCDIAMTEERGVYRCILCRREFYEENGRLVPATIRNAMAMRKKIRYAESAYDKAVDILSHLEKEGNRNFIASILRKAGKNVKPSDFEGARLVIYEEKEELTKKYGLRMYPLTIIIAPEKSSDLEKRLRKDPNAKMGGINIAVEAWPFSSVGGIRLSFKGKIITPGHEDLHGTFNIYRGDQGNYAIFEVVESWMLNEINSYRNEVERNCSEHLEVGDYKVVDTYWTHFIKGYLLGTYLPEYLRVIRTEYGLDEKNLNAAENIVKKHLEEILPVIAKLQIEYDESVLSRVLIKSRDFRDVKMWYGRKDILAQWQKRALVEREREVKKFIVEAYQQLHSSFKEDYERKVELMVKKYWRFIGKPMDEDGMNRYIEKLIKDAIASKTAQAKGIGKELGDLGKEGEVEGEKEAEGIGKDLEELDEEENKEETEEAREIGKELDEI